MKAIICEKYGPPEVLKLVDLPKPIPKPNEVLVRVVTTAVNSGDVRVRGLIVTGLKRILMLLVLGFRGPRKPILGTVFSGIIEQVGEKVTRFQVGDEVFGMTGFGFGTYAEYLTIKEDSAISYKPKNASHAEAVSLVFGGSTAYWFLEKYDCLGGGKNVLIYGGTGSVGVAAIQLAIASGNQVTVLCGESGVDLVASLGVEKDRILTYKDGRVHEKLEKRGEKYDFIFHAAGNVEKKDFLSHLKPNGKFASVEGWEVASETRKQLEAWRELYESGKIKAIIDKEFTLENIVEAHRYVDTGRKKGNVVVKIANL